jgi:hypothetical protein
MMQFINNQKQPFSVTNREDLVRIYLDLGYEYVPILYDESLKYYKPIWNGTEWIEGITDEEIAEQELEQQKLLKQQQYEELLPTDWYVVRFIETGVAIPEEILQQRQEIRDKYK